MFFFMQVRWSFVFTTMVFNLTLPAVMHNRFFLNVVPNIVTSHLLHTLILETGLVGNTAQQIESASQLKRHTYLIQPVIQGYALLPLHNTFSMFVTPTPKIELKYCHFTYCKLGQGQLHLQLPLSILCYVIVRSSLWGAGTKVHITHIITNTYYVNAHIADHSGWGEKDT